MAEKSLAIGFKLKGATTYTIEKQLHQGGFGITYLATAQIMVGNIPQAAKFTIKEFFISKIDHDFLLRSVETNRTNNATTILERTAKVHLLSV